MADGVLDPTVDPGVWMSDLAADDAAAVDADVDKAVAGIEPGTGVILFIRSMVIELGFVPKWWKFAKVICA